MRNSIQISLLFGALTGLAAVTCASASSGRELLFSAPVQQVDRAAASVTVLGHVFQTPIDQISVGQIVNIYGVLNKDGSVGDAVIQGTQSFGANGDPVFVKGMVTDTDALLGHAQIDGMTVDYTAELGNPDFIAPSVGDVMAIAASQPAQAGTLIATATGDSAYAIAMSGSGTSMAAVRGGAKAAGMSGGGVASAGMSGGGVASAGMSGGGVASAGMSGGGVASAGMSGGGVASAGMSGGGVASAGMSGGGVASAGMSGGGVASAGMSGGGVASAGMSGGGVASAGMSGGGVASAGMSGGGVASAGMSGGGVASAGMSGGGVSAAGMNGGGRG